MEFVVKCKSRLSSPVDWILRYIKTYFFNLVLFIYILILVAVDCVAN